MNKKVLHVSAGGLGYGGVSTVIFDIVEPLHEKFTFGCVVYSKELEREALFQKYGTIHRLHCYPKKGRRDYVELLLRPFKLYFGVRKICKTHHYDVIHCHNQRDEWICLLAAKHAKVPMRIAHSHVTTSPKKRTWLENWYRNISPRMLRKVATVSLGCSELACSQFYAHFCYEDCSFYLCASIMAFTSETNSSISSFLVLKEHIHLTSFVSSSQT